MGHRLSRIYTRTGDKGETGLGDGSRRAKDDARIEAIGTVDELNSTIGVVLAHELPDEVRKCLERIQHDLFDLGGDLSVPSRNTISAAYVHRLENELDWFNTPLPRLKEFTLPSGGPATAACHVARTVCRRAERRWVTAARHEAFNPEAGRYINRLSDLLYVLCRVIVRFERGSEVLWQPGFNRSEKPTEQ